MMSSWLSTTGRGKKYWKKKMGNLPHTKWENAIPRESFWAENRTAIFCSSIPIMPHQRPTNMYDHQYLPPSKASKISQKKISSESIRSLICQFVIWIGSVLVFTTLRKQCYGRVRVVYLLIGEIPMLGECKRHWYWRQIVRCSVIAFWSSPIYALTARLLKFTAKLFKNVQGIEWI